MSGYLIRSPRVGEAETIADVHLRTWEETYAGRFPPTAWNREARTSRIAMWEAICSSPREGDRFAVAELGREVVGFAGVGPSQDSPAPREKQLWFLYLLKSAHDTGGGQALLDEVLGDAPASLWVLDENPRAKAFYARNGFAPDGFQRPSGYDQAGDEIRMLR